MGQEDFFPDDLVFLEEMVIKPLSIDELAA
jgi:hypothetical protein